MKSIFFNNRFIFQNAPLGVPGRIDAKEPGRKESADQTPKRVEIDNKNPEERAKLADKVSSNLDKIDDKKQLQDLKKFLNEALEKKQYENFSFKNIKLSKVEKSGQELVSPDHKENLTRAIIGTGFYLLNEADRKKYLVNPETTCSFENGTLKFENNQQSTEIKVTPEMLKKTIKAVTQMIQALETLAKNPQLFAELQTENLAEKIKNDPKEKESAQKIAQHLKSILEEKIYKNITFSNVRPGDFKDLKFETEKLSNKDLEKVLTILMISSSLIDLRKIDLSLQKPDTIYSYSDGVLKAENSDKKGTVEFPESAIKERLEKLLALYTDALQKSGNPSEAAEAVQKSGKVHLDYLKKVEDLPEETVTKDRTKLKGSSIEDVRYNSRLLKEKAQNEDEKTQALGIKEETERRIKSYASKYDKDWYQLNYGQLGSDQKGRSHEMSIGVGDILIDPDIKNILVERSGELIEAHRGIVKRGKHKGRLGFVDKHGDYVYTHTGDKFRLLDNSETVFNDSTALATYTKSHHYETQVRISHHQRAIYEEEALRQYSSGGETGGTMELDENHSVVEQIKKETFEYMLTNGKIAKTKLNEKQIASAKIIEEVFRKGFAAKRPEVPKKAVDKIIAAAIVNAFHESSLYPSADGKKRAVGVTVKGEDSVGLFALYIKGRGHGMTDEERKDPYINTQKMLDSYVFSRSRGNGTKLIEEAIRGASVAELAAIFCKDGERPAKTEQRMKERAFTAENMFNGKKIESGNKGKLVRNFENEHGQKGRINIASNQPKWVIGSSTVYGLPSNENWGTFATIGAGPKRFLKDIQNHLLPGIEQQEVSLPKEIVIVGLPVNGLTSKKDPEKSARENIDESLKIAEIFKDKGVQVKITTLPPYQPKIEAIKAFNHILRTEYPDICLDTAKELTTEDGNSWKEDVVAKDGLHLNAKGKRIVQSIINEDRLA